MKANRQFLKHTAIVSGICAALFAQHAMAAGFQLSEMSPSLEGQAYAGAAATKNDPSAMAYNPATLATVQGNQLSLGATYIIPHVSYSGASATEDGIFPMSGVTSQANITPAALAPDGYIVSTLPHNIKIGLSETTPWGLTTDYDNNWVGRNNAVKSSISTIDVAPTIAYQINPYIAVGAAAHVEYMSVDYGSYQYGLVSDDLKGNSYGLGYGLGFLLTPTQTTSLGVGYRSKVTERVNGTAYIGSSDQEAAKATITLPQVLNIGVSQQITSKLTGLATAQWTGWDSMQSIAVYNADTLLQNDTLDWKNSWMFSLGTTYQLTQKWVLRTGVAYDATPTQDAYRDPRIPDSNRYWVTVGAGYSPISSLMFNVAYEHIFMMPQNINVTQPGGAPGLPTTNQVSANYSGHADIIAGSVNWTF